MNEIKHRIDRTISKAGSVVYRNKPAAWGAVILLLAGLWGIWADPANPFAQPASPPVNTLPLELKWAPTPPFIPTLTPFQPALPTLIPVQPPPLVNLPDLSPLLPTLPVVKEKESGQAPPPPSLRIWGINFGDFNQRVTIQIIPPDKSVNRGQPILISFIPGTTCVFGDHRACVSAFRTQGNANLVFVSIHSGVGGEAQTYRNALEGTGINQAAYSLLKIRANLQALDGASITLTQGSAVTRGLVLDINARVPAAKLEAYFEAPLSQALAQAASIDPVLKPALTSPQPELVFETCGWKSREEPWAPGVTSTSASIYLGVIRQAP